MSYEIRDTIINIKELFDIVNKNKSVRLDNKTTYESGHNYTRKVWQLEKISNDEYCYKTFDSYGKTDKHSFFINTNKADKQVDEYYYNFRKALCDIMSNVYGNRKIAALFIDEELLDYDSKALNYTNLELIEDRKNRLRDNWSIQYAVFNTKIFKSNGIKHGENVIRIKLSEHLVDVYPNMPVQDEYSAISMQVRPDSVVFTGAFIHTYEIKSDVDSFTRLNDQINGYREFSEYITLVLHVKKLSAFMKNHSKLLDVVGLMVYSDEHTPLKVIKKAKKLIPNGNKINLLWSNELHHIVSIFKGVSVLTSGFEKAKVISKLLTKSQAIHVSNMLLKSRFDSAKQDTKVLQHGGISIDDELIKKFNLSYDKLQLKFDKLIRDKVKQKRQKSIPLIERLRDAQAKMNKNKDSNIHEKL